MCGAFGKTACAFSLLFDYNKNWLLKLYAVLSPWVEEVKPRTQFRHPFVPIVWPPDRRDL